MKNLLYVNLFNKKIFFTKTKSHVLKEIYNKGKKNFYNKKLMFNFKISQHHQNAQCPLTFYS
jgi:hypothetical protein